MSKLGLFGKNGPPFSIQGTYHIREFREVGELCKRKLGSPRLLLCTSRIPNLWMNTKLIKCFCIKQPHLCKAAIRKGRGKRRKDKNEIGMRTVGFRKRFKYPQSTPIYSVYRKSRKEKPKEVLNPTTYSPQEEAYSLQQVEVYPKPVNENQPAIQDDSNVDPSEDPAVNNSNEGKTFCQVLMNLPPRYQLTAIYTNGTVIQVNELISVDAESGEVKFTSDRTQISSLSCAEIDGIALGTSASKPQQDA